jgi:hypothetical protein
MLVNQECAQDGASSGGIEDRVRLQIADSILHRIHQLKGQVQKGLGPDDGKEDGNKSFMDATPR